MCVKRAAIWHRIFFSLLKLHFTMPDEEKKKKKESRSVQGRYIKLSSYNNKDIWCVKIFSRLLSTLCEAIARHAYDNDEA